MAPRGANALQKQPVDPADLGGRQWSQDLQDLDALCQDIETDRVICSELFVNLRKFWEEKEAEANFEAPRPRHRMATWGPSIPTVEEEPKRLKPKFPFYQNRDSQRSMVRNFGDETNDKWRQSKSNIPRESFRRKTSPVESSAEPEEAATRDPPTPRRSYSKSAPTYTKPKKIPQKTQRFSISNLFTRSTGSEKENHTSVSSIPAPPESDEKYKIAEVLNAIVSKIPIEKNKAKAKELVAKILSDTKNLAEVMCFLSNKMFKKTTVFGSTIQDIVKAEKSEVPKMLVLATEFISKPENIRTTGIYRQNGNMAIILGLKVDVEKGDMEKLSNVKNVHLITGLTKLFFRELKEPLIPQVLLERFSSFVKEDNEKQLNRKNKVESIAQKLAGNYSLRKQNIQDIFMEAKEENRRTLLFMVRHLDKVLENSDKNKMGVENLSIVFGPTLSRIDPASPDVAAALLAQNEVVRLLIEDSECRQALEDSLNKHG